MSYTIPQIIQWSKIAQPLARVGEKKRLANGDTSADADRDIKIYLTRKDVEWEYGQNPNSDYLFSMGNYLISLMGIYLFAAQSETGSGGTIAPLTPSSTPDPYDFDVSASSFIVTGATSKVLPNSWIGFNILLVRGHLTQSKINNGFDNYYTWDRGTATLNFYGPAPLNGAAVLGENIQIFMVQ